MTKKNRGRVNPLYETFAKTFTGNTTNTTNTTNWTYWPAPTKSRMVANWDHNTEDLIKSILVGLARKHGGSLVIPESDLGDDGDQVVLEVNEKAGLITITLIPDYVKVGVEPTEPDLVEASRGYDPKSVQFYLNNKPFGVPMPVTGTKVAFDPGASTTDFTIKWDVSGTYTIEP